MTCPSARRAAVRRARRLARAANSHTLRNTHPRASLRPAYDRHLLLPFLRADRQPKEQHDDDQDCAERKGNPPGKLAEAELHFTHGPLEGLKLIGFAVWERKTGDGRNVTFPARQYSVNGERRSFALLRPIGDTTAQDRIRDLILQAYAGVRGAGGGRVVAACSPD